MRDIGELYRRFERRRRFWRQVDVQGREECWPWQGELDADGHGRFGPRGADVEAYELARGPLPPEATLSHQCGNPRCVNPEHLEVAEPDRVGSP